MSGEPAAGIMRSRSRKPWYRLAPELRPRPRERREGDGETVAPFMERLDSQCDAVLGRPALVRAARRQQVRRRLVLLLLARCEEHDRPTADSDRDTYFDLPIDVPILATAGRLPAAYVEEALRFWIRAGLVVVVEP